MKKIIALLAVAMLAMPVVKAQKVDVAGLQKKIATADAAIADAKKSAKASTWINHAKAYFEAAQAPTSDLYYSDNDLLKLKQADLESKLGQPEAKETVELNGAAVTVASYPWVKVYIANGAVIAWKQTKELKEGLIETAIDSYNKAYQIDPKTADKVKVGMDAILNHCVERGEICNSITEYETAAESFMLANRIQESPVYTDKGNKPNLQLLYYAGMIYIVDGAKNPASYQKGIDALQAAMKAGYNDEKGELYYYIHHGYLGLAGTLEGEAKQEQVIKAKNTLLEGIEKYPDNENILTSLTMLYMRETNVGDINELVDLLTKAINKDPQNAQKWSSLGLLYYKTKDYEKAIEVGQKAVQLMPKDYDANYRLAYYYTDYANALREELSQKEHTSIADSEADLARVKSVFMQAFDWFEKAHEIDRTRKDTVEMLKSIAFVLRDEPGMMDKYNKYNELFKNM